MNQVIEEGTRQIKLNRYRRLNTLADELFKAGVELPENYKRRDTVEPDREEKELLEDEQAAIWLSLFAYQKKQIKQVIERIHQNLFSQGSADAFAEALERELTPELLMSDSHMRKLINNLDAAAAGGLDLFIADMTLQTEWTLASAEASKWATVHAGELVAFVDDYTQQAIGSAVSDFITVPGTTIGDVVKRLPYSESRAYGIAVTEITEAYAQGGQIAGEALAAAYPDVQVVKKWFTNNDGKVCPICRQFMKAPYNIAKIDEPFIGSGGYVAFFPGYDSHPRCRCWTDYMTVLKTDFKAWKVARVNEVLINAGATV